MPRHPAEMAIPAVHVSLSSKGYEPLVCAHARTALLAVFGEGAIRHETGDRRRPLACMGAPLMGASFGRRARSSVG